MISERYKTIFVHNPKAAGSSIKQVVNSPAWEYNNWHYPLDVLAKKVGNIDEYFKFGICRNPYDRLVSSFSYNMEQVRDRNNYNWKHYPFAFSILTKWVDLPLKGAFHHFVNSDEFDLILDREWPVVYKPQHTFLISTLKGVSLDFVGRFETMGTDSCDVSEAVHRVVGERRDIPRVNYVDHGDYKRFYTIETMERVFKKYQVDFLTFDYDHILL